MIFARASRSLVVLIALFVCVSSSLLGQEAGVAPTLPFAEDEGSSNATPRVPSPVFNDQHQYRNENQLKRIARDLLSDQKDLWTSPARLRAADADWLVPLSGITAGLFTTDAEYSRSLSHYPATISRYNTLSNAGIAGLAGGAGAMWLFSYKNHNAHWRETGLLAGEATLNSFLMIEAMKYSFGRQRPNQGNGDGAFFSGGTSFPSEHAAAAWAMAGIFAHEYPGVLTKILAYGTATAVSVGRVHSLNHFQSDVLIGALIGNLAAVQVYKKHHDVELGGGSWDTISDISREARERPSRANMASPYVPIDSWVYPAMDRLIAVGLVRSAMVDLRPWTRFEFVRLLAEAGERLELADKSSSPAAAIYSSLVREFRDDIDLPGGDNTRATLESVYTRISGISGQPLSQGYHYNFGQTIINDYGRPNEEGFNNVTGFSGWATDSRLVVYASGEFQYSPSAPAITPSARAIFSQIQLVPAPPNTATPSISHFQWLDTYVGFAFENWQLTYGKQSLWWGPGAGGPMMFSNNAAPVNMFRISRVSPFKLPFFGPMSIELFLGQLTGQNFIAATTTSAVPAYSPDLVGSWSAAPSPQPMISGERFTFKPTPNVEFGFVLTTIFAGGDVPLTPHTYIKSIFSAGNTAAPWFPGEPGDRRSGFTLSYRLPLLRNWVTFYADGFADDQFTPVAYWDRSAWTAGLYVSHLPKVPKLDLRVEGVYSDLPAGGAIGYGFFYFNGRERFGYSNAGNLMGSWIGRDGQGAQVWSNYWFSPKNRIQLNFRHQKVSQQFLPGGGSLTDIGVRGDLWFHNGVGVTSSLQFERWLYPVIQPGAVHNVTAAIEMQFQPQKIYRPTLHYVRSAVPTTNKD